MSKSAPFSREEIENSQLCERIFTSVRSHNEAEAVRYIKEAQSKELDWFAYTNHENYTILHCAALAGYTDLMTYLLENYPNITLQASLDKRDLYTLLTY
jgi:ankyrin repeat protein